MTVALLGLLFVFLLFFPCLFFKFYFHAFLVQILFLDFLLFKCCSFFTVKKIIFSLLFSLFSDFCWFFFFFHLNFPAQTDCFPSIASSISSFFLPFFFITRFLATFPPSFSFLFSLPFFSIKFHFFVFRFYCFYDSISRKSLSFAFFFFSISSSSAFFLFLSLPPLFSMFYVSYFTVLNRELVRFPMWLNHWFATNVCFTRLRVFVFGLRLHSVLPTTFLGVVIAGTCAIAHTHKLARTRVHVSTRGARRLKVPDCQSTWIQNQRNPKS